MSASTANAQNVQEPGLGKLIARRIIQVLAAAVLQAAILFVAAWDLRWGWGWANIGVYLGVVAFNLVVFSRIPHARELIAERGQVKEDAKLWDRILATLAGLVGALAMLIVAGLDHRFRGTAVLPAWVHWFGLVLTILGYLMVTWAMTSNAYFSSFVRIQQERGHQVATTGPYRLVRHPGYVGMIIANLMTPLMLGSLWALIPGGIMAILIVARTALEDRTLQAELSGYQEYAQQTRYRLFPGIW